MSFSIKISGYQCFGSDAQGFEEVRPVNVIIGRNNSGKSSLLDMVGFASNLERGGHPRGPGTLHYSVPLRETMLGPFPTNRSGGEVSAWQNHRVYAASFVGKPIAWSVELKGDNSRPSHVKAPDSREQSHWEQVASAPGSRPLSNTEFLRLGAARDVTPAQLDYGTDPGAWSESGESVTRTITAFLRKQSLKKEAVTEVLLERLNRITGSAPFLSIDSRTDPRHFWEVCLKEGGKSGEIALSRSGAGLKTILCVLTLMELRPRLLDPHAGDGKKGIVFALEELENNLHPALQRRLLQYVRDRALELDSTVFLTTHSPVAIDLFEGDEKAQIVHVTHDGTSARVSRVDNYGGKRSIIDDIGAKASDLLQANCVVWVEGPSDRIYFNRWIQLWTNGELREGAHYQCMFYGGALLSHVSADAPEAADELVRLLKLNRNAICVFDHDGDDTAASLKRSVLRVKAELEANGGLAWVTAGREVENYLPPDALQSRGLPEAQAVDAFCSIFGALVESKSTFGKKCSANGKVWMALELRDQIERQHLETHLDLATQLARTAAYIQRANFT